MKFPCRICSTELTDQQMLKNHFTFYHPENLQFQCRTCHIEFDELSEIVAHMGTHLKTSNQCSLCLQILPSKKYLHDHYVNIHPGVDRTVCLICNKKYSDPGALAKHTMVHTGERPYYCPFCFMTFGLKCSQVVHIRRHTNYRPYKCQYCPKRFFNAGEIGKHVRLHTGEKPYKCSICKTAFTMRETLTSHLKTHKKFVMKCQHCPMGFNDRLTLEKHMTTHSGVMPFKCPLCSVTNFFLRSLKNHIVAEHTDNIDTNCQICGQVEEDTESLAQHILTHRTDYVKSRSQWVDYIKKATKSHLDSKSKCSIKRKTSSKKTNRRARTYNDMTTKSHLPGMVEELKQKCENDTTCASKQSSIKDLSDSQSNNLMKKGVRRKSVKSKKKANTKKTVEKFEHKVDSCDSSAEEYEEKFEIPPIYSSEKLIHEDINENVDIKTEIKVEDDDEQIDDVHQKDSDEDEEGLGGIQEVDAPAFEFLPQRKEMECSLCQEYFMSQDELLQHVSVHI